MRCPSCGDIASRVTDSRRLEDGTVIRRRRVCDKCKTRFVTYERIKDTPLYVVKRDGRREIFDPGKILAGIVRSCNKRHITMEQMEGIVSDIETEFLNSNKKELETREIGEYVMKRLKELDEVCYIRFASVYKKFSDVNTFLSEITGLLQEKTSAYKVNSDVEKSN